MVVDDQFIRNRYGVMIKIKSVKSFSLGMMRGHNKGLAMHWKAFVMLKF